MKQLHMILILQVISRMFAYKILSKLLKNIPVMFPYKIISKLLQNIPSMQLYYSLK